MDISFLDRLEDIFPTFLISQRVLAPFLLLLAEESGIPLLVPGDVVVTFLGFEVSRGKLSYFEAFMVLFVAVIVGSSILFYLSSRFGKRAVLKLGRFVDIDEEKLDFVEKKFKQYGPWVIIIGRHIPGFRVPITIFAGISSISYRTFIICTTISVIPWIVFYLYLGAKLGSKANQLFNQHQGLLLFFAVPFIIALLLFLFRIFKRKKRPFRI